MIVHKNVKVAQWKNGFIKIQQIWIFPPQNWELGFCFGFCKGDNSVPHWKTLAQLTPSYWKTEKNSSLKGKQRVTGKENSNLLYDEVFLQNPSSTEPPLKQFPIFVFLQTNFLAFITLKLHKLPNSISESCLLCLKSSAFLFFYDFFFKGLNSRWKLKTKVVFPK